VNVAIFVFQVPAGILKQGNRKGAKMQLQPAGPMTNQITFEGYVVRAWMHGFDRFLRLANHRPANQGGPIPQNNMVYSDYTTVRLDSSIEFDVRKCRPGTRVVVRGRLEGRDIPETLGEILMHCNVNLQLPMNIANIVVTRPTTQIFAATLDIRQWHPEMRFDPRDDRHSHLRDYRSATTQASIAAIPVSAVVASPLPELGQDLAELMVEQPPDKEAQVEKKAAKKPARAPKNKPQ
jgi:hypothetical protein